MNTAPDPKPGKEESARPRRPVVESSYPPRSAWRARAETRVDYLQTQLNRECADRNSANREALTTGAQAHLDKALQAIHKSFGWRRPWSGSTALESVWSNIRTADVLLLQLATDKEVSSRSTEILALAEHQLDAADPQRVELVRRLPDISAGRLTADDRGLLVRTLDASYISLDAELARVRSLRNILWSATLLVFLGMAALAIYGWISPKSLSLCFMPKINPDGADQTAHVVCPTKDFLKAPANEAPSELARPGDILAVEIAGLAGAALTVIASLRRIPGTSAPFMLPLASAVLKFPTGALSAFLGLLLIRGAFVPGLSDLDSRAQVLAWASVFGAAQHLVTRLVDDRAQMTLSEVGKIRDTSPGLATTALAARSPAPPRPPEQPAEPGGEDEVA